MSRCDTDHCAVCLDDFTDPRIVPCGNRHVFCLQPCLLQLETYHRQNGDDGNKFPCPLCREPVIFPPDGVKAFQPFVKDSSSAAMNASSSQWVLPQRHGPEDRRGHDEETFLERQQREEYRRTAEAIRVRVHPDRRIGQHQRWINKERMVAQVIQLIEQRLLPKFAEELRHREQQQIRLMDQQLRQDQRIGKEQLQQQQREFDEEIRWIEEQRERKRRAEEEHVAQSVRVIQQLQRNNQASMQQLVQQHRQKRENIQKAVTKMLRKIERKRNRSKLCSVM